MLYARCDQIFLCGIIKRITLMNEELGVRNGKYNCREV